MTSEAGEESLDRELLHQVLRVVWRILRWPLLLLSLIAAWLIYLAASIVITGAWQSSRTADVGIVLGAGVTDGRPSPPFMARIEHGVALYKAGKVRRLILTGTSFGRERAEAIAARDEAIAMGVPSEAILIETVSRTTLLNFVEAKKLMDANGARTALVITEPLHMMRSLSMARGLGIDARGDPPAHSFYQDWPTWFRFIRGEIVFYHFYLYYGT